MNNARRQHDHEYEGWLRRFKPTRSATALTAALTLLAQPALGQEEGNSGTDAAPGILQLAPVQVEALRFPRTKSAVPNTVTIIEQESLERQTGVSDDISTILGNLVPNFSPSRQKLTGAGETLRGRSPLYLLDGVPQSNPLRDSARDGHTIDPALLERVEVVNGSNAVQGLGAAGGIINLQTRSAARAEHWTHIGELRLSTPDDFDSDGLGYKGVYLGGRKWGKAEFTIGGTYQTRELYFDGNDESIGIDTTQGDLADSDSRDLFLKAAYQFTPDQRVQLLVNDYRIRGDGDYVLVPGDRDDGVPATARRGDPRGDATQNDVTTVSLDYRHNALWGGELRAQAYYQDFAALFGGDTFDTFQDPAIAPEGTLFDQSENRSRKQGIKLSYSYDELGIAGLSATGGLDYLQDETAQVLAQTGREWVPETTFENWAPFVQLNQAVFDGRVLLSGGLRYEYAELQVDDFTTIAGAGGVAVEGGRPAFDELLPNAGIVFDVTDDWSVYGSYSKGFTVPDVGRVLRAVDTPGQRVDDLLTLEPVLSDNRELGVDYERSPLTLHAAYFWSDSDLGSRLENVGGIFEVRREQTEIQGFELSADYAITNRVRVGTLYSYIRGEFDSDDDGSVDTDLDGSNINPDRLNLYVQWQELAYLPVAGRLQASHFFDRDFNGVAAPTDQNFDGYTRVDLSLAKTTDVGTFRLGVENLLDEQYITYYSQTATTRNDRFFAGRGRTFVLSYEAEL